MRTLTAFVVGLLVGSTALVAIILAGDRHSPLGGYR